MRRLFGIVTLLWAAQANAATPSLQAQLEALAKSTPATVGIVVERVERKQTLASVRATRPFPLASTFKLPLALVVLRAVERHQLPPLDRPVRIEESDLLPGNSDLADELPHGGERPLRAIVAGLLETSDNSAANVLMRLMGGGARVTAALRALGLDGIAIDRDETALQLAAYGLAVPPPAERTLQRLDAVTAAVPRAQHRAALAALGADPRDHATPQAMTRLIERAWSGELLDAADARFLREELLRAKVGPKRLRAGLPPGTPLAHRTGTCAGLDEGAMCANDVGIVTLPSGEQLALTVYVEDAGGPLADKEALIARVARLAWSAVAGAATSPAP